MNISPKYFGSEHSLSHNAKCNNVIFFAHLWKQLVAFLSIYIHTLILLRNVAPEFVSDSHSGTANGIVYLYIMHVDQLQMRSKLKEVTAVANNRNAGTAVPHKNGLLQKHLWSWLSFFQHV
jgi:hypothetical protein